MSIHKQPGNLQVRQFVAFFLLVFTRQTCFLNRFLGLPHSLIILHMIFYPRCSGVQESSQVAVRLYSISMLATATSTFQRSSFVHRCCLCMFNHLVDCSSPTFAGQGVLGHRFRSGGVGCLWFKISRQTWRAD